MISREKYISEIRGFYDSDLVKVITGVRRCGKSVILEQIVGEIRKKTDNVIFLDFDDQLAQSVTGFNAFFQVVAVSGGINHIATSLVDGKNIV